jgi:ubiquinone/menaquinone biosynthesis C-methylase UbiE
LTNVDLRKMDAEHLDFPDQSCDFVSCSFAFFLFPDQEAALREMYRVCKPGGYIGMSTFDKKPPPFNPARPMFLQQARDYRVAVPMPHQLDYAPEELEAFLSRFGFRSIETYSETNETNYASVEDYWEHMLTVGPRLTIMGMDEKTRARFKDEYLAKLRPMLAKDGLHLSVAVVYAVAQC